MEHKANESVFPLTHMYNNEKQYKDMVYLRQPIDGVFHEYTWGEVMDKARRVATFLLAQGFKRGDHIAILSKNCAEWFITDFGIMLAGLVSVPLYATQYKKDIAFVLDHSGAKAIFIGKLDNFKAQEEAIPEGMMRIDFPYQEWPSSQFKFNEIIEKYDPMVGEPLPKMDELITIMYTSGTTGNPKGVMYTYETLNNFMKYATDDAKNLKLTDHEHYISYLPLAHAFERIAIEYFSIELRSDISFVESIDTFGDDIRAIEPTIFIAVPRIWSVFQTRVLEKLPQHKLDILLKIPGVSWLIKRKIKHALGFGRAHLFISGAASIPQSTLEWYQKLGINITEGYGSTENSIYATVNNPESLRFGSVGAPRSGVEIKVDENGELLIKSPGDMAGYYKEPELTKNSYTDDGFLRTGDMGHIDEEGNLFIIGRIKEQFKSAKGEFVVPVPIENKFAVNKNIEQCCLVGLGLNQPILLASLSESARKKDKSDVEQDLLATLEEVDEHLNKFEKVSHIFIVSDEWTPENNLLTPTQKIKRHALQEKYGHAVNDLQKEEKKIAWEG